jgi:indole-3-glycerol phosphate synthase
VLDRIVATKQVEVAALQGRAAELRVAAESAAASAAAPAAAPGMAPGMAPAAGSPHDAVPSFEAALRAGDSVAVIAEVKRRSPSAGGIREGVSAAAAAQLYAGAGAAAVSVLTDGEHFGGSLGDLQAARVAAVPLLRKDFVIDAVQVHEARVAGASAVLLIVRILDDAALRELHGEALRVGLDVLVEVHDEAEVERAAAAGARIIGINNRDLATFTTDLDTTLRLAPRVPAGCVVVAESAIREAADVARVAAAGADAVLVGEALMRAADPAGALRSLASVPRSRATR